MVDVLLARYADCIFWLARYVERAENLARILDVNETFSRDSRGGQNWRSIIQLNSDEERFFAAAPRDLGAERARILCRRRRQPDLDRQRHPQRARECAHLAAADLDRDVGPAQRVLQPPRGTRARRPRPGQAGGAARRRSRRRARPIPASPRARSSATRAGTSTSSAAISSAPTRRRDCSTSNTICCCPRSPMSARRPM